MERVILLVGFGFELAGVLVIVAGTPWAAVNVFRVRTGDVFTRFRADLAGAVLLGLEFPVAADIIRTVSHDPVLEEIVVLGLIVLIRTFLSFTLQTEIDGRLPWQRGRSDSPGG